MGSLAWLYGVFVLVVVQVLSKFMKPVSGHDFLYKWNSEGFFFGPVQESFWKVVVPEEDMETKERFHFFMACIMFSDWVFLSVH